MAAYVRVCVCLCVLFFDVVLVFQGEVGVGGMEKAWCSCCIALVGWSVV